MEAYTNYRKELASKRGLEYSHSFTTFNASIYKDNGQYPDDPYKYLKFIEEDHDNDPFIKKALKLATTNVITDSMGVDYRLYNLTGLTYNDILDMDDVSFKYLDDELTEYRKKHNDRMSQQTRTLSNEAKV